MLLYRHGKCLEVLWLQKWPDLLLDLNYNDNVLEHPWFQMYFFTSIKFNDGNSLLFHCHFIPLCLTQFPPWKLWKRDWYLNIDYLFFNFVLPLIQFYLYLLLRTCKDWSTNLMDTSFYAMKRIPISDASLLANLRRSSICSFK